MEIYEKSGCQPGSPRRRWVVSCPKERSLPTWPVFYQDCPCRAQSKSGKNTLPKWLIHWQARNVLEKCFETSSGHKPGWTWWHILAGHDLGVGGGDKTVGALAMRDSMPGESSGGYRQGQQQIDHRWGQVQPPCPCPRRSPRRSSVWLPYNSPVGCRLSTCRGSYNIFISFAFVKPGEASGRYGRQGSSSFHVPLRRFRFPALVQEDLPGHGSRGHRDVSISTHAPARRREARSSLSKQLLVIRCAMICLTCTHTSVIQSILKLHSHW